MSGILPTLILEPKPPELFGHRKASTAAPKPDRLNAIVATMDRLKNWRRVTPSVSSSGGTQATGGGADTLTGLAASRRAATAASSTSRPVAAGSSPCSDSATGPRSRRAVSLDITPATLSVSRRRAVANSSTPAARTSNGIAMARIVVVLMCGTPRSQVEEEAGVPGEHEVLAGTPEERAQHDQHRPRHQEDREQGDGVLAVFGLLGRVAVDEGGQDQADEPDARQGHARHHGVEHGEQLLQAQEVPGGLGGVGRLVRVGQGQQR